MTRGTARLLLTYVWWVWGLLLFTIVIYFTMKADGADKAQQAWQWFLPNLMPVLSLVGAAAYQEGKMNEAGRVQRAGPMLAATLGISAFYLVVLSACTLQLVFSGDPIAAVRPTGLFLGPLQAATTTFLGLFFVRD